MGDAFHRIQGRLARAVAGLAAILGALPGAAMAAPAAFPSSSAPALSDDRWEIALYRDGDQVLAPATDDGAAPSLTFKDGRVTGEAGCGPIIGEYRLQSDVLQVSLSAVHAHACAPIAQRQERLIRAALGETLTVSSSAGRISFRDADGVVKIVLSDADEGAKDLASLSDVQATSNPDLLVQPIIERESAVVDDVGVGVREGDALWLLVDRYENHWIVIRGRRADGGQSEGQFGGVTRLQDGARLERLDLRDGSRRLIQRSRAIDLRAGDTGVYVLSALAHNDRFQVTRYHGERADALPVLVLGADDRASALIVNGDAVSVLSNVAIHTYRAGAWMTVPLSRKLYPTPRTTAASVRGSVVYTADYPTSAMVKRIDLKTGAVTDVAAPQGPDCDSTRGRGCVGVNALSVDPDHPDCVLVGFGSAIMLSESGGVARACMGRQDEIWHRAASPPRGPTVQVWSVIGVPGGLLVDSEEGLFATHGDETTPVHPDRSRSFGSLTIFCIPGALAIRRMQGAGSGDALIAASPSDGSADACAEGANVR